MSATAKEGAIPRLHLIGVFGGLFFGYLGLVAVIPVLPAFLRQHLGAANFAVGLVITITGLTALVTRPLAGNLADRHGYRQVMQLGALIVAAGGALYFIPLGVAGLIAVRLMLGVGEAALFTAGAAWSDDFENTGLEINIPASGTYCVYFIAASGAGSGCSARCILWFAE